jgi:regulator of protease activity HflC (stomatin/prohibitin superfamily)
LKAEAQAEALRQIEDALQTKGGKEAAQFILGQRYIQAYRNLGRRSTTLIMPSQPQEIDK